MPTSARDPLLAVKGLSAGYGKIGVLKDVDIVVYPGEIVAMLGPNGAGKTTLLRAISGLLPWTGEITVAGRSLARAGPRDVVRQGVVHVVEGHRVFTQISVEDNVLLAGYGLPAALRKSRVEEALDFFPEIKAKRNDKAVTLSGGQQQMLAVAQGLVRKPRLLMLDEPSAGLSPVLVDRVLAAAGQLRAAGTAVLLVEQLIEKSLAIADRVYALARGTVILRGPCRSTGSAATAGTRIFRRGGPPRRGRNTCASTTRHRIDASVINTRAELNWDVPIVGQTTLGSGETKALLAKPEILGEGIPEQLPQPELQGRRRAAAAVGGVRRAPEEGQGRLRRYAPVVGRSGL